MLLYLLLCLFDRLTTNIRHRLPPEYGHLLGYALGFQEHIDFWNLSQ
jgi:hypothetical protein